MTDDEILSVVQAHKEGKKIQFQKPSGTKWWNLGSEDKGWWNFEDYDYRVSPEPRKPREFWLHQEFGRRWAIEDEPLVNCCNCIHVREVIE